MKTHRISLSDAECQILVATLKARRAMTRGERRDALDRLIQRLDDPRKGNPNWIAGEKVEATV